MFGVKMNYNLILVLCLHISSVFSAPMKDQMMPIPFGMQSLNPFRQLQNPFFRQPVPNLQIPFMYQLQPMIPLLPPTPDVDDVYTDLNNSDEAISFKTAPGRVDENKDSVILEAEQNPADMDLRKAVVLMPNGARYALGQLISYIPFLPIHINVPDTINWIGSFIPGNWFGRPVTSNTKRLSDKGPMPIFMVPVPYGDIMPQI